MVPDDLPFVDPPSADYKSDRQIAYENEQRRMEETITREGVLSIGESLIDFAEIDRILQIDLDGLDRQGDAADTEIPVFTDDFPLE